MNKWRGPGSSDFAGRKSSLVDGAQVTNLRRERPLY
jgi:hypothetical protein